MTCSYGTCPKGHLTKLLTIYSPANISRCQEKVNYDTASHYPPSFLKSLVVYLLLVEVGVGLHIRDYLLRRVCDWGGMNTLLWMNLWKTIRTCLWLQQEKSFYHSLFHSFTSLLENSERVLKCSISKFPETSPCTWDGLQGYRVGSEGITNVCVDQGLS